MLNRRGFLGGLISALAAPAIVRIDSIMPVISVRQAIFIPKNNLLTISMITREAIQLFKNSNAFLINLNEQYDREFDYNAKIVGSQLKIKNYKVAA